MSSIKCNINTVLTTEFFMFLRRGQKYFMNSLLANLLLIHCTQVFTSSRCYFNYMEYVPTAANGMNYMKSLSMSLFQRKSWETADVPFSL